MIRKLIVLQGPPHSGKSSEARKMKSGNDDYVIICRDDIRISLGDLPVECLGKMVSEMESDMLIRAVGHNCNIIVDSMNLNPSRMRELKQFADKYGLNMEVKSFYVPFAVCVARDGCIDNVALRLGAANIRSIYQKYFPEKYEYELAHPEEFALDSGDGAAAVAVIERLQVNQSGQVRWYPTFDDLSALKKMATLRFRPSDIAVSLGVPYGEFNRLLNDVNSKVYESYMAGKIESEIEYRSSVVNTASRGEEWAIKMVERWSEEQAREEGGL